MRENGPSFEDRISRRLLHHVTSRATREKPFSGLSATGREKLEVIWVRGQNIEIFIKSIKFQDLTLLFFVKRAVSVQKMCYRLR